MMPPLAFGDRRSYFEDLEVGAPLETRGVTVTDAHAALFGGLVEGRRGDPKAVPDLLPLCLSSGLGWRLDRPPLAILAFMGFEWRFLEPVRVGDTIRSRSKTLSKRQLREGGVVIEQRDIVNQRGQIVQSGKLTLLVARRSGGEAALAPPRPPL